MIEVWPKLLAPQSIAWQIAPMLKAGPASFTGKRQKVATGAGYWTASLNQIPCVSRDQVLEFRGLIAGLQGGAGDIRVGPFDCRQVPWPGDSVAYTGITHSDGSTFSDGAGYRQSTISVVASEACALRATSMTVTVIQAGALRRGMYFSVAGELGERMYIVTSIPEVDGDQVSFSFLPELRIAHEAGQEIEFGDPRCLMRLASPTTGGLDLDLGRWGFPSVDLEESYIGLF